MNEEITTQEQVEQVPQAQSDQKAPSESWREANARIKQQEEENRYLREQTQFLMQQLNAQLPQKEAKKKFSINDLPEDDIATTTQVRQAAEYQEEKIRALEAKSVMLDMREKYDDFRKVCSTENLARLEQEDPDLASTIMMNPSLEKKLDLAYKAIKKFGIYKEQVRNPMEEEQEQLANYNANRPKPVAAAKTSQSKSPLGAARPWSGVMTEEQKAEQYRRSVAIANGE